MRRRANLPSIPRSKVDQALKALDLLRLSDKLTEVRITADAIELVWFDGGEQWTTEKRIGPRFSPDPGSPRLPSASFARVMEGEAEAEAAAPGQGNFRRPVASVTWHESNGSRLFRRRAVPDSSALLEHYIRRDLEAEAVLAMELARREVEARATAPVPVPSHGLFWNHNGDPVCRCGWDPVHGILPPTTHGEARRMIADHVRALR